MPFLPPNQQRQSTEGCSTATSNKQLAEYNKTVCSSAQKQTKLHTGYQFAADTLPAITWLQAVLKIQACVQPPTYAENVTLLASAARCRPHINQSIYPGCRAHSSSVWQTDDGTERQTDCREFNRPCSAYYASSVNNMHTLDGST